MKIEPKHIFFCVLFEVGGISFLQTILFMSLRPEYVFVYVYRYLDIFLHSQYICMRIYVYIYMYIYQFIIYRLVDPDPRCGLLTKSSFF